MASHSHQQQASEGSRIPIVRRFGRRLILLSLVVLVAGGVYFDDGLLQYRLYTARSALDRWDDQRALAALQQAARSAPESAEVQFLLARTNRRLGRYENVRGHLQKAAEQGFPVEKIRREQLLAQAQIGQMNRAEPYLSELLLNPGGDGREICAAYVSGFFINLRFAEAMAVLDAWQADFPNDAEPYFRRAQIRQALKDSATAAVNYRKGLKLVPGATAMRVQLAHALSDLNKPGEAEREYRRCRSEDSNNVEILVGLAKCLFQQGEVAEAESLFRQVVQREPAHPGARLGLARLSLEGGDAGKAVRWVEPLLRESPRDTEILLLLAQANNALGKKEKAKELFRKVDAARELNQRLDDLISEVLRRPDDPDVKFKIGTHLIETGAPVEGARWLRTVLQLDKNHLPTHRALAQYYADSGQSELAQQHRDLAEKLAARQTD